MSFEQAAEAWNAFARGISLPVHGTWAPGEGWVFVADFQL